MAHTEFGTVQRMSLSQTAELAKGICFHDVFIAWTPGDERAAAFPGGTWPALAGAAWQYMEYRLRDEPLMHGRPMFEIARYVHRDDVAALGDLVLKMREAVRTVQLAYAKGELT